MSVSSFYNPCYKVQVAKGKMQACMVGRQAVSPHSFFFGCSGAALNCSFHRGLCSYTPRGGLGYKAGFTLGQLADWCLWSVDCKRWTKAFSSACVHGVAVKGKGHCVSPSYSGNQPQLLMKVNREQYTAQKQAPNPTCLGERRLVDSTK